MKEGGKKITRHRHHNKILYQFFLSQIWVKGRLVFLVARRGTVLLQEGGRSSFVREFHSIILSFRAALNICQKKRLIDDDLG